MKDPLYMCIGGQRGCAQGLTAHLCVLRGLYGALGVGGVELRSS